MSTLPRRAQCRMTAFGEAVVTFPYNALLVADLKECVPFRFRTFDPSTKAWTVSHKYAHLAISLLLERFPDADVLRRSRFDAKSQTRNARGDHFAVLHLLPSAPPALIDAPFRCLAKIHHPDVGGDPAAMRRLSEAREALGRRLGA